MLLFIVVCCLLSDVLFDVCLVLSLFNSVVVNLRMSVLFVNCVMCCFVLLLFCLICCCLVLLVVWVVCYVCWLLCVLLACFGL